MSRRIDYEKTGREKKQKSGPALTKQRKLKDLKAEKKRVVPSSIRRRPLAKKMMDQIKDSGQL
jgi:hypothetical protein